MRQLLPLPAGDVVPYEVYRVAQPRRFLRINMVASVDGSVTDDQGRAGGLGGDGDWEVFRALRALADGILVGAGTARTERYGPHRLTADLARRRAEDGRPDPAAVVVVSRSLDFDVATPLFAEAQTPTLILTCAATSRQRRARLTQHAGIVVAGDHEVDLTSGLEQLAIDHGLDRLVCEGGPTLNAALFRAGLVDELCVTVAPLLTGARGSSIVEASAVGADLELLSLCEQDGEVYIRYAVRTTPGAQGSS